MVNSHARLLIPTCRLHVVIFAFMCSVLISTVARQVLHLVPSCQSHIVITLPVPLVRADNLRLASWYSSADALHLYTVFRHVAPA